MHQHRGTHAEPDAEAGLSERLDGVDGQDHIEDESEVEEVTMDVLQQQREPGLSAVGAVRIGHGTGRGSEPERAVVGLPVVVAGEPESEREDEDQ